MIWLDSRILQPLTAMPISKTNDERVESCILTKMGTHVESVTDY